MNDKRKIFPGNVTAKPGVVYEYEEITGNLDVTSADAETSFPNLTTIGVYAYFRDWTGSAPKLTAIGGDAYFRDWTGSAPKLTTIGGDANFWGWTGSAPKLITANKGSPEIVRSMRENAVATCRRNIFQANLKIGYYFADGILARLVNRRGHVARVIICGKTTVSYVVNDGNGNYSHGATLAEARAGLIYKLSSRDATPFKKLSRDSVITLADAIKAYRAITGACEMGTRHFCEQVGKLPEKLSVADAIKLTRGQYGHEAFAVFFAA